VKKSVEKKKTEENVITENPPVQILEKLDTTEKREGGDTDADSREQSPEKTKQKYAESVKPYIPQVEDEILEVENENNQILLDVHFEKNTNDNEMVLFHLNGFFPPVVYSAESGELLVVCDFLDAELGPDGIPVIAKGGRYIRQIKVEPHQQPKKVRVVLELADSYTYDVKQVFFKEENLFVIVLKSLGEKKKEK
jgi:hypothetical protein